MQRKRPTSIMVIAILQLVFGGIMVLVYVCGGIMTLIEPMMAGAMAKAKPGAQVEQRVGFEEGVKNATANLPGAEVIQYVNYGVGGFLTLAMIAGGVGLLRMRNWGRALTIAYACVSIADKVFDAFYSWRYEVPALRAFLQTFQPANDSERMMASILSAATSLGPVIPILMMIYPCIVLGFMLSRNNRAAFQGQGAVSSAPVESDQIEADDRWGNG